jgi:hypothetical protein
MRGMGRTVALLLAATLVGVAFLPEEGLACEGREMIFQDGFKDDAGGWSLSDAIEVKDESFVMKLGPDAMEASLNLTHTVKSADICADAVWPAEKNKVLGAGLLFWGEDNRSYFQFGVLNNGKFWIARRQNGKWSTVVENVPSDAIKTGPDESNTLRVSATGNTLSFYINGEKVRDLRGQAPEDGWWFGLSGDNFDKAQEAHLRFKSVKVTE